MKTNSKLRLLAVPLAVAGIALVPMIGCDELTNAQQTLCCSEFVPGNDLSAVDWGLVGQANVNYGALMQAMADFSASATSMASDVSNACQAIATDLGADPKSVTETQADKRVNAWCTLAVAKIKERSGQASISIAFQPPVCTVNASLQASCEARCSANVDCEVTPAQIIARCEPGKLSGRCEATCNAKCEGSAQLAVACDGTCQGVCEGTCAGNCDNMLGNQCNGRCDSTCNGKCRGSCDVSASGGVQCDGDCTGGCTVEVKAPKCKGELKPPSVDCQVDADCNASCKASASAKVDCTEPSLTVVASAGIEDVVSTLKINLPKLLLVTEKVKLAVGNAQLIVDASGSATFDSTKAVACLVPAGAAMAAALSNIEASGTQSISVTSAVAVAP